jgi:hypothetical protein
MTNEEIRRLEMFRRVRNFGTSHDVAFPAGSLTRDLFDIVAGIVLDLEGHAAAQSSGRGSARQNTTGKAAVRAALREGMEVFRRTARAMSLVTPGLAEKFRLPRKANDHALLETARAFLADATALKAEFMQHSVPERVFQDLEANIAAFNAALDGQYAGNEASVAAVAAIDAAIVLGMNSVRRLDPCVRNRLGQDAAGLAAWESARHIERPSRGADTEEPEVPSTPEAPPAPQS